jgi:hypothetical protein
VNLPVPSKVGDHRKVPPAAVNVAGEWLLASVAVHVRLKRARPRKSLVTNLALVLLLRVRGHFGRKLTHHG